MRTHRLPTSLRSPRTLWLHASGLLAAALLAGCTDYSVSAKTEPQPGKDEPEPEPEPEGPQPNLVISPDPIPWGNVLHDCPKEQVVTMTNDGEAPLEVSALRFGGDDADVFGAPEGPWTLEPGASIPVTLSFTPGDIREHSADLVADSNDPDGELAVPMQGEGVAAGLIEESWVSEPVETLDVLWVVDNSCSMSESVDMVRTNFTLYIEQFLDLGIDYHLATVTTDMDDPAQQGRFQGEVITAAMTDAEAQAAFLASVDAGAAGSADEKGFAASQAALSEPLLSSTNVGFLREDAHLAVIVLTDENDASSVNASDYVRWLQSLKPDPAMVKFHGFMGLAFELDIFGCTVDSASTKYIDAANMTGGYAGDICTDDWRGSMSSMSLASGGIQTTFTLSSRPDSLSAINVTVDGVRVRYDPVNGWTWDEITNTVALHGSSLPNVGQTVLIEYESSSCG